MPDSETPEFYSTVPISSPTVVPEAEDVLMNGFAWSTQFGLLLSMGESGDEAVDQLVELRENLDEIDINQQGIRGG